MDIGLAIAGIICVAMAVGHETIGSVWVLPGLSEEHLPKTPFGPVGMTRAMVRVTWHIVTVFVLAIGLLLVVLAWNAEADSKTVLLRVLAGMWVAATAMAAVVIRPRWRSILRLPVPFLWAIVAVLCWRASM